MSAVFEKADSLLYRPGAAEAHAVSDSLRCVFQEYPFFAGVDARLLDLIFYVIAAESLGDDSARVYSLSPQLEEAAVWQINPESSSPLRRAISAFKIPGFTAKFFHSLPTALYRRSRLMFREIESVEERIKKLPLPDTYLKLEFLMVKPEGRGQGRSGRLLRPVLEKAAELGMPVLLDTNVERNVEIYRHYGFEVVDYFESSLLSTWIMMRAPV